MIPMRVFLLLFFTTLIACQASPPKFESRQPEEVSIAGSTFEKSVAKDTFGSKWKLVELRPKTLPYTGETAKLSAQERWVEIFKVLLQSIKAECNGPTKGKPKYRADELDFSKFGDSPQYPKFAQARFRCP